MIQIDMPMPKSCRMCPACSEYDTCLIPIDGKGFGEQNVSEFIDSRPEWCPMKERAAIVPSLMQDAKGIWNTCGKCGHILKSALLNPMDENDTFFYFPKFCSECGQEAKWND